MSDDRLVDFTRSERKNRRDFDPFVDDPQYLSIGYVEMIKAGRLNENYGLFGYGVSNSEVPNFKISRRQRVGDGGASFVGTGDVDELKAGLRA